MEYIEINEVINVCMDILSIPILMFVLCKKEVPRYGFFLIALLFIILSHIFTVAETFFFFHAFNLMEHIAILISSVFFCAGTYLYFIRGKSHEPH